MAIKTTKWDATEALNSEEAIAAYLEAAFEDGDPVMVAMALGDIAKVKGMASVAREAGITREALYKSLSNKGDPKLSTLLGVMKALGLSIHIAPTSEAA